KRPSPTATASSAPTSNWPKRRLVARLAVDHFTKQIGGAAVSRALFNHVRHDKSETKRLVSVDAERIETLVDGQNIGLSNALEKFFGDGLCGTFRKVVEVGANHLGVESVRHLDAGEDVAEPPDLHIGHVSKDSHQGEVGWRDRSRDQLFIIKTRAFGQEGRSIVIKHLPEGGRLIARKGRISSFRSINRAHGHDSTCAMTSTSRSSFRADATAQSLVSGVREGQTPTTALASRTGS